MIKTCKRCGEEFLTNLQSKIFCSEYCQKAYHLEMLHQRKEERHAAGLCVECGDPVESGWLCPKCRRIRNIKQKAMQDERRFEGLCPLCGAFHDTEYVLCPACRAKKVQYRHNWKTRMANESR